MSNWQQEFLDLSEQLDRKLDDAKTRMTNKNQKVQDQYSEAVTKVKAAREAVHRLAAYYNE